MKKFKILAIAAAVFSLIPMGVAVAGNNKVSVLWEHFDELSLQSAFNVTLPSDKAKLLAMKHQFMVKAGVKVKYAYQYLVQKITTELVKTCSTSPVAPTPGDFRSTYSPNMPGTIKPPPVICTFKEIEVATNLDESKSIRDLGITDGDKLRLRKI